MTTEDLVAKLIALAVELQASDIHFDPRGDQVLVRLRIHGRLIDIDLISSFDKLINRQAIIRLKVLAKLSLAETRRPQDGHLYIEGDYGGCDLRVATIPTVHGERVVIRLIPVASSYTTFFSLGMTNIQISQLQEVTNGVGGMIIVSGRVGAGKSTTVHAILAERARLGDSILTIEDPVERRIQDYQQVEVDERIGLTFAEGLRAAVRQDPDVLMVGEIRDELTAQIAVRAGLTGHLLLSTMHADHGLQVIYRLLELGISSDYVRQSLKLVIWQTLLPIVCPDCQGQGCDYCHGIGLSGRRAEFSFLTSDAIERHVSGYKFKPTAPSVASELNRKSGGMSVAEPGAHETKYREFSHRFE
ncbi:MAG: ATPase, T2SS/T4P/T4SS family [Acidibacillus sp.]|nr:ATPase, T2SS/T4P/T4SS family [Acidibacillus sp.]